jgi:transposase
MNSVIKRRYTVEFKGQAVGLVMAGRPVKEVARDLGLSEGVLYEWIRKAEAPSAPVENAGQRGGGEVSEADELRRLRRENAQLKLDNDILKKAAVLLGTKTLGKDER